MEQQITLQGKTGLRRIMSSIRKSKYNTAWLAIFQNGTWSVYDNYTTMQGDGPAFNVRSYDLPVSSRMSSFFTWVEKKLNERPQSETETESKEIETMDNVQITIKETDCWYKHVTKIDTKQTGLESFTGEYMGIGNHTLPRGSVIIKGVSHDDKHTVSICSVCPDSPNGLDCHLNGKEFDLEEGKGNYVLVALVQGRLKEIKKRTEVKPITVKKEEKTMAKKETKTEGKAIETKTEKKENETMTKAETIKAVETIKANIESGNKKETLKKAKGDLADLLNTRVEGKNIDLLVQATGTETKTKKDFAGLLFSFLQSNDTRKKIKLETPEKSVSAPVETKADTDTIELIETPEKGKETPVMVEAVEPGTIEILKQGIYHLSGMVDAQADTIRSLTAKIEGLERRQTDTIESIQKPLDTMAARLQNLDILGTVAPIKVVMSDDGKALPICSGETPKKAIEKAIEKVKTAEEIKAENRVKYIKELTGLKSDIMKKMVSLKGNAIAMDNVLLDFMDDHTGKEIKKALVELTKAGLIEKIKDKKPAFKESKIMAFVGDTKAKAKGKGKAKKADETPTTVKAPATKKGGMKRGKKSNIKVFIENEIKKGNVTKKDILAEAEKQGHKISTVNTYITDGKNTKYCKFDSLIIENKKDKTLSFK